MSDAFSEMFPTNTVVVGPALSSASFALTAPGSFFGVIGFCAIAIVVGTRTCNVTSSSYYSEQEYRKESKIIVLQECDDKVSVPAVLSGLEISGLWLRMINLTAGHAEQLMLH